MPRRLALLCLLLAVNLAAATWEKTVFQGEAAWKSTGAAGVAIVSEARCRLLQLSPAGSDATLLNAPTEAQKKFHPEWEPNWGGHRFWLGPQARWVWPPLPEWENAAAEKVEIVGDALVLTHPRVNTAFPQLIREYAWEGARLRCTVKWRDDGRAYYGMHVFVVDAPTEIEVALAASPDAPEGIVAVRMDGTDTTGVLDRTPLKREGDTVRLVSGAEKWAKVGFRPQVFRVHRAGTPVLRVEPGPTTGAVVGACDHGYLSQLWVGPAFVPFAEVEQLSPFLLGDKSGWCSSTAYLSW
ncbi:hypothetical protein [Nibricoccus sp. IMCC34717]|uniref:hypothetical protein n=1 Tax=Nibricoccus sp. IMCC34717 TaxID=3034021 RepID=UPI00384BC9E9